MPSKLKTKNCVLAYIDILGAKEMIKKDIDGSLNIVHEVYQASLELYKKLFSERILFNISIFSDNIVIAGGVESEAHLGNAFKIIQIMTAIIQGNFLFRGLLCRGAITYGKFFKDSVMIWGGALVRAYTLESSVAIYPRIIIDPELVGNLHIFPSGPEYSPYWLKQDIDGLLYVDYLKESFIKDFDVVLLKELGAYDERLIECGNDIKIMQKNIWQINYVKSKVGIGDSNENDEGQRD